eukprot:g365.t1
MASYYDILGVAKTASEKDIRKAYRKAAIKWHPDKNQGKDKEKAAEMFKKVAEAYDVLRDPEKRKIYDVYGEEGLKGGVAPNASASNPFGAGGGARNPFGNGGGARAGNPFTTGPSPGMSYSFRGDPFGMFAEMMGGNFKRTNSWDNDSSIPFSEMFGGGGGIRGGGFSPAGYPSGATPSKKKAAPTIVCNVPMSLEDLFKGGDKRMKITRKNMTMDRPTVTRLTIPVKPGWKAGLKVTFKGEGDEIAPGVAQDIQFVIQEKKHSRFVRHGKDLHMHHKVPLLKALTGFTMEIETLDKRTLKLSVPRVFPETTRIVSGEGMPSRKHPGTRGNLVISFEIVHPKELSTQQKAALKRILPDRLV